MATVLVADDEESVRDVIRYALRQLGHHVLESRTGTETIELLMAARVDLLILDVMMPDKDGYDVELEVSKTEKLRDIPVIVISARQITRELFAKFPQVRKFVPKPFDPVELSKTVDEILKDRNGGIS